MCDIRLRVATCFIVSGVFNELYNVLVNNQETREWSYRVYDCLGSIALSIVKACYFTSQVKIDSQFVDVTDSGGIFAGGLDLPS